MSSLVDAVLNSDFNSDAPASSANNGDSRRRQDRRSAYPSSSQIRSSSRPRGPPSESAGALSDIDGFLDDDRIAVEQSLRRQRAAQRPDIPRVTDVIGENVGNQFQLFLDEYVVPIDPNMPRSSMPSATPTSNKFYATQIHFMRVEGLSTLYVDFEHLVRFESRVLADSIIENYYRFMPFINKALNNMIAKLEPRYFREHRQPDSTSTMAESSLGANATSQSSSMGEKTPNQQTDKLFTVAFYNLPQISRIRQLRTKQVGRLTAFSGTVTRTSEVRPELHLGTFVCEICQNVVYSVEQSFRYTEPQQCPNAMCNNKEHWRLDIRQSTFLDWQKIRVQENSSEIPTGSMPRTMDVIVRGEMVDRAKAGEKCIFTGTLISIPDVSQFRIPGRPPQAQRDAGNAPRGSEIGGGGVSGLKTLGVRDLTYRLAFLACMIRPDKRSAGQSLESTRLTGNPENILSSLDQRDDIDPFETGEEAQQAYLQTLANSEVDDLREMVHMPNIYMRLVDSIAPMIYGHEIVKKGLLLQLMGGVSKQTQEGMALRGDINVCIVGDPSTSKSQFLKYICSILPRAVYTSGKASSAAGLTAAVVKDEETGDFTIEAGALMLADNGICCIDEFDKMDIADQVAIHEAMEQQTISIAKAGIQATLNARTSILAAANPVGGRYNRKTTLRANINMSAPIMSRFDLFFVVLDECNESVDRHLASHIVGIHQLRDEAVQPEFSTEQLQRYIRFARTFKPEFTPEAKTELVARYKELRADDAQGGIGRNSYRITVRQLESMIRLSEAIAKANCVSEIIPEFVREAFRLLRQSIISVEKDDVDVDEDEENLEEVPDTDMVEDITEPRQPSATPGLQQPKGRTQITWDKYMKIVNLLVKRINSDEQGEASDGVEQEDLVVWYLEQIEDTLETEAQLEEERQLVQKVIKRMVKENVVMLIRGEGLADEAGQGLQDEQVKYILHPNFAVEELS